MKTTRWLMLILVASLTLTGCTTTDIARLWDKYRPDPTPVPAPVEQPEVEEGQPAPAPAPAPTPVEDEWTQLHIPFFYDRDLRLEFVGTFQAHVGHRIFRTDKNTLHGGWDAFFWGADGRLRVRPWNGKIKLTGARVGDTSRIVSSKDHYLMTTPILSQLKKGKHTLTMDYMFSQKRVVFALDGQIIADFDFVVIGPTPARTSMWTTRFKGRVQLIEHGGGVIAEVVVP